jgi:tRNA(fMet)-specific endonuclease VapC
MYALDTNTVIYFLKGKGGIAQRLLSTPPREIGIPAVVVYELEVGLLRSSFPEKRRAQLAELIGALEILPFGEAEAKAAARIRSNLEGRGLPIGPLDTLIAATALSRGATLVTHNVDEFGRVAGLAVQDWY